MKTRSIFFSLLFATGIFLTNCSGDRNDSASTQEEHTEHKEHESNQGEKSAEIAGPSKPQFEVDEKFQNQLSKVFVSYVDLKEAFVNSDASKVQTEATETQEALKGVDMKLLSGAAHNDWMNYLASIQNSLSDMASSEDLEDQRKSFSTLSESLYKSIKAYGLGDKDAYYEYCPMAFNDQGAYWLSDQEKIRNPYFGDKMLSCGTVKEKL